MDASFLYFDVLYALHVHDIVLRESGGLPGVLNQGTLESVLAHMEPERCAVRFH
jgi:death-on-curing protein